MDPRYHQLADVLTGFSTKLQPGDKVLIDAYDVPDAMVVALIRAVRSRGALPFVQTVQARISRELYLGATDEQFTTQLGFELARIQAMDAYIALRGAHNIFENSDVPSDRLKLAMGCLKQALDWRVNRTRWVVLRWPTPAMAQQAMTSTESFEDFYFRVCTMDYSRFIPGMKALKARMDAADAVRIVGPGTDLRFSLKGIQAITCGGDRNIPDGEVYTSPVRDSVEGTITFNAPSVYQGVSFDGVRLEFRQGRIVDSACPGRDRKLREILDTDEGARFIGEFALGFNPHILEPMRDILFDEKIAGSFHFTPGQAYANEADNGNRSQIHWDMVCIQRPEYGGGEIWFDGEIIRRDGRFLPPDLALLNPDALLAGAS